MFKMKSAKVAIIYTMVTANKHKTCLQFKDFQEADYEVVKVFSEEVSGYSKPIKDLD